jgi:CMP-N,N'-diacetyllegionaminic acid synthase
LSSIPDKVLFVIPARGGSKGIPQKNIKLLAGKPIIYYSIDVARQLTSDEHICVSTDDDQIIKIVQEYGLKIYFKRPAELGTDVSSSNDVLLHALNYFEKQNIYYDIIVLLQPTSPIRTASHVEAAFNLYNDSIDMVVSVKQSHSASVICKETSDGFLTPALEIKAERRQDICDYYEYNGSIYIINVKSLKEKGLNNFDKEKKYLMPAEYSIDIDTNLDWIIAEALLTSKTLR